MGRLRAGMILVGCVIAALTALAQTEPARQLWQKGQEAMRERQPERAIGFYEKSLEIDPSFTANHLSLAAACAAKGDESGACVHLAHYLDHHPDHHGARAQYAELLLRLGRVDMARLELCRFLDETARDDRFAADWIHCHQRLAEIAQVNSDHYQARLHRGISLYLIAQQLAPIVDDEECNLEGMLCRAAAELTAARALDRGKAQPCWYLHLVWAKLGQSRQAGRYLREARGLSPFNDLTGAEELALSLRPER